MSDRGLSHISAAVFFVIATFCTLIICQGRLYKMHKYAKIEKMLKRCAGGDKL